MIGTESGVDSSRVYSVGCSGVRVAGGDAHSLTPGHAYVTGNHIANFSLWKRTYMPGIFWNGAKAAALSFAPVYTQNDHFTKTGSGQT